MPNVRKKGKVMVGGYMSRDIGDAVGLEAEKQGMTKKDLVEDIIRTYLRAKGALNDCSGEGTGSGGA